MRDCGSCSVVLWCGDMNYRLEQLDGTTAKSMIDQHKFKELVGYDQVRLCITRNHSRCSSHVIETQLIACKFIWPLHLQLTNQVAAKRVFENYVEPIINFRPTYKYDVGTDNWDSRY
jgi:hypothetical protein